MLECDLWITLKNEVFAKTSVLIGSGVIYFSIRNISVVHIIVTSVNYCSFRTATKPNRKKKKNGEDLYRSFSTFLVVKMVY